MAKRKYDLEVIMLTLFVAIVPIIGAIGDKTAVIYASLLISLLTLGKSIGKRGSIFITKTALLMLLIGLVAALGMIYVTNKGSQLAFASMFITAGAVSLSANALKDKYGREAFLVFVTKVLYISALIYALAALFYQIFVEANPLFGGMDLGGGSQAATAVIMIIGIVSCLRLFYGKEKTLAFYPSLVFMGLILIATGSLVGYLMAAILVLVTVMNAKRKKVESLICLAIVALFGAATVIYALVCVLTGKFEPEGAFRGLVNIIGIGYGGFNASQAVIGGGYEFSPALYTVLVEVMGTLGIVVVCAIIFGAYVICMKKMSLFNATVFLSILVIMCTSSASMCYTIPLLALITTVFCEEEAEIVINRGWRFAFTVPIIFCALLVFARIPYRIGSDAYDLGNYSFSADCYAFSASCQIFDSHTYEKAYEASFALYEQTGEGLDECEEYLEKAMKFNKKNYEYKIKLADVYTKKGDAVKALKVWDDIIARYDKEELYVSYAEKIRDAIRDGELDIASVQELYNKLLDFASRIEDGQIKFEVNNILSESQRYYIEKREGQASVYYEQLDPVVEEIPTDLTKNYAEEI